MILEDETFEAFGYHPCDFKKRSWKLVISVCTLCGEIKIVSKHDYYTFCQSCIQKGKKQTEEVKAKKSAALKGKKSSLWKPKVKCICLLCGKEFPVLLSDMKRGKGKYCCIKCKNEAQKANWKRDKNYFFGKKHTDESKALMSTVAKGNTYALGCKRSDATKAKLSAAKKGKYMGKKNWRYNGGKKVVHKRSLAKRKRQLGYTLLLPLAEGEVGHHITNEFVIGIPKEVHIRLGGGGREKHRAKVLEWLKDNDITKYETVLTSL